MTKWPNVKLADCVALTAGFAFKSENFTDRPDDIALVKGENVSQGCILWDISKRWPAADWKTMERFQLRSGDVVVAMDRPWVPAGLKWAFIRECDPKALLVQRCARLRASNGYLDQEFLRFVIGGAGFESYVKPITTGVNVPHISGQQILNFEFLLPPLSVQRRIAGALSAYDELMENGQRRIRILEQMVRALYREWFGNFKFQGNEKTKLVDSQLGSIPKGWTVKKLGDIADISWGDTSTTKASYREEGYTAYSASGADGKLDHYDLDRTGIVLSAIGAQCGKTWLARGKWSCIKNTIRFWSKDECISTEFLFIATEGQAFWPRRGAAQPFISQGDAERIDLLIPDLTRMKRFTLFAGASLERIATLQDQIKNLRCTRDLLLPRLLSGQLTFNKGEGE